MAESRYSDPSICSTAALFQPTSKGVFFHAQASNGYWLFKTSGGLPKNEEHDGQVQKMNMKHA